MTHRSAPFAVLVLLLAHSAAPADDAANPPNEKIVTLDVAIERGLSAIQKAAGRYPEHRKCFSCHHQTLPMLAQVTWRARGGRVDDEQLNAQSEFTLQSFRQRHDSMARGQGIGGRAMTIVYAMWAAALAEVKPNDTTAAMAEYLLKTQRDEGHWIGQTSRPPLEESYLTCTVLAISGLRKYATVEQVPRVEKAVAKAQAWLLDAPAKTQEDRVARLWGLHVLSPGAESIKAARHAVLRAQREDGGWAQIDELDSDAYATGQTLYVLQATGLSTTDCCWQRGATWLLKHQRDDGNWHVESRSKPIQTYYDSDDEDPLKKDQFISVPATSWAVAALAASLPAAPAP